jgi:CheY-like chemotaxis protein
VPRTILLVDDEFSAEVLAILLRQEGFDVVTASDGEEAIARLRERTIDLVITDYWMPRMSGLELVDRMQADEAWRSIPVLLVTATYDSDQLRHPALAGIVAKPTRFDTLLAAVRRLLAGEPPR